MTPKLRQRLIALLLCCSLLALAKPAKASDFNIGPTKGQVVGVVIAIVAVGAAIGVGVYFLARRPPSLTGCATTGQGGLQLQNETDQQTFTLIGDTALVKPGDRIRVSGKKKKKDAAGKREFLVEKMSKDFGACKVTAATP